MIAVPAEAPLITVKGGSGGDGISEELIRIRVDKMQVRMDFKSAKDPEYIQIQEWARSVFDNEFGNKHGVWSKPGTSLTKVSQALDEGGTLYVMYGKLKGEFRGWFEFNPGKVSMAELEGRLSIILDRGFYSLLERGIVSYCEFAVDILHAKFDDYLFLSRTHHNYDLGWIDKGTLYIGSREHGELSFIVYDKQKQLSDVEGEEVGHPWLRIEARLRGDRRFPFMDILTLPDPFANLLVLRRSCVVQAIEDGLLDDIFSIKGAPHEVQYQLACLAGPTRKAVADRLSEYQPSWWHPGLWKRLEDSLHWLAEGLAYEGLVKMW